MNFLGVPLYRVSVPYHGTPILLESMLYPYIKTKAIKAGWRYVRVENKLQNGFPDIFLLNAYDYCLIEVKYCRKRLLTNLLTDLRWQVGQPDFFYKSLVTHCNHMLAVYHKKQLHYFTSEFYAQRIPKFIFE